MSLPITLTAAAAAALLNLWLALRVSRVRIGRKVMVGDGGDAGLQARMRAQANFVEYAPFVLILLGLVEITHGSAAWLWGAVIVFTLGRVAHAFGMDRAAPNPLRMGGIIATWAVTLVLAAYALSILYLK